MNIIAGTDSDGFLARRGAPLRPPLPSLSFDNHLILHAVNPAMELDARLMAIIDEGKGLPCDDRLESELLAVVDQVKPNVWTVLSFYRKGYVSDGAEVSELTVALVVRPDSLTRGQAVQVVENMAAVLFGYVLFSLEPMNPLCLVHLGQVETEDWDWSLTVIDM